MADPLAAFDAAVQTGPKKVDPLAAFDTAVAPKVSVKKVAAPIATIGNEHVLGGYNRQTGEVRIPAGADQITRDHEGAHKLWNDGGVSDAMKQEWYKIHWTAHSAYEVANDDTETAAIRSDAAKWMLPGYKDQAIAARDSHGGGPDEAMLESFAETYAAHKQDPRSVPAYARAFFDRLQSADVRGQIAARKANPPTHRFGAAPSEPLPEDVPPAEGAKVIGGGVLRGLGIPTSVSEIPGFIVGQVPGVAGVRQSAHALGEAYKAKQAGATISEAGDVAGKATPNPVEDLAGPAKAVMANRPPTKEENLKALGAGGELGTIAAMPAVLKGGMKLLEGRAVPAEATPAAETPAEPSTPAPEAPTPGMVTVHRGIPADAPEALRPLDSVTTDRAVAETYAGKGGKVVSHEVPAEDLRPVMGSDHEHQFMPKDQVSTIQNMPDQQLEQMRADAYREYQRMEKEGTATPAQINETSNHLTDIEFEQETRAQAREQAAEPKTTPTQELTGFEDVPTSELREALKKKNSVFADNPGIVEELRRRGKPIAPTPQAAAEPSPPEEIAPVHADAMNPVPIEQIGKVARKFAPVKEFTEGVNPAGASEGAAGAADILRKSKSEIANAATLERYGHRQIARQFNRAGDAANIENISTYERTGQFKDAPPGYSEFYRDSTDAAHQTLREVYGDDRVGFVDNYVRRAFKFGSEKDAQRATSVLSNWIGSLSASKAPLKGRVLSVPLDEAMATMKANGIDVRMATTNPELLRQWTVENANQAKVYKQAWADAREGGLVSYVPNGKPVPRGFVPLNDRVATVFFASEKGPVLAGKYFAEPGVARIFNNAISRGLGGSPTFRAIREINNTYNQFQLGLSGFHLTGTAINAGISDLSLGIQQVLQGDFSGGAKAIGRSAVPGLSFARDMYRGRSIIEGALQDDPVAMKFINERLNPAGGRLAIDSSYRTSAYENMVNAWSNRRFVSAMGRVPLAVVQKVAQPLMEYAIPRVKIGAFMDLAEVQLKKLGAAATDVERQRALQVAWDSIDNRFGQLVHDNLFWNRTASDLAQVGTRSVGWNLGTVREIGGGVLDLAKGNVSPRALYSFALPVYAGMIGAVYQYLHTGKGPSALKDYYYPRNGLTDDRGREDRITLPTYMKDEYAYTSDPVSTVQHKASPILAMAADLATNRDYYGDMIHNPDETAAKKRFQDGAYVLKNIVPFSIQQAMKTAKEGGGGQAAEQFFGFVKAPGSMKNTEEENQAMRERRRAINERKMDRTAQRRGDVELPEWMRKMRDKVSEHISQ